MPKSEPNLNKTILHIPVTVCILVPVELDEDVSDLTEVDEVAGCQVVDVLSDTENADRLIELALEKTDGNDDVIEALSCLLQGVHLYQGEHPMVRATYTPFMGVIKEQVI